MAKHPWYNSYPSDCKETIDCSQLTNVADQLDQACRKFANKTAISCPIAFFNVHLTFTQYEEQATRLASFLQNELGIQKGDRVAIMLPNLLQFPIVFYAAQKIGAVCVNTNPLYTAREMKHQFNDSGAETVVMLDLFLDKLDEIIAETKIQNVISTSIGDHLPFLQKIILKGLMKIKKATVPKHNMDVHHYSDAIKESRKLKPTNIKLDDISVIQYTGGTTGVSKGAMLSHKNILGNIAEIKEYIKSEIPNANETVLTALPLYHIFALTVNFLAFLVTGQHMVLVPKPVPISNTIKVFKKYPISVMTGVNTIFNSLNHCKEFPALTKGKLKYAVAGGMALHKDVAHKFKEQTGVEIIEGFGLTEASPATHLNPLDGRHKLGSIGLPLPGTIAKIVDESGNEVPVGQPGELIVSGPQVMKGYWQRPDETAKAIRDGFLWTGDIAKMDDKGYFYIVDRKKDMILVSGFNVYPNEVEDVICSHPKVLEAAVIGVEDKNSGEAVKAFVVKKDPSLTESELKDYCRDNLTGYKRPRTFVFREDLPKTNVGKVLRRKLKDDPNAQSPGKDDQGKIA